MSEDAPFTVVPPFEGDGSRWVFDMTTAEADISAYELLIILQISLRVPDGMMTAIKTRHPRLLRHFRHEAQQR
jgi:hypothetical protein